MTQGGAALLFLLPLSPARVARASRDRGRHEVHSAEDGTGAAGGRV